MGIDLVHIPSFREQLELSGSRFERVFSSAELRVAGTKIDRAEHLAGRWAAKEAFIKAWSQALFGTPPPLGPDEVDISEIEVVADRWGRVAFRLRGSVDKHVGAAQTSLSISHDGEYATAVCAFAL
ncbi:holo-ACP synthase [Corynebacterium tapiri]|uniref:Holo-ACP synthase n=1 Tax=Corynebacterium tapiri TaxID=1448266 RepID=A0A5C4U1Y3_9CORY|nr:holo-ACP synthase [Corynebacterium tapiri]TNL95660.1 holo-ACP synthase [Corynebacterium tapiri]